MTKSDKQSVECLCPLCNETHHLYIFWTGSLPARKHCQQCKDICNGIDCYDPCIIEQRSGEAPEILDECR